MAIDKHIYFSTEEVLKIEDYCKKNKKNKLSFSKAVCKLADISLDGIDTKEKINKLESKIDNLLRILNIILALEKQIYSDMEFENITDPNKSKQLDIFFKKVKKEKYND